MSRSLAFDRVGLSLGALGPARVAFIASLILSAIAISGGIGPNRDGMLYIDTARLFLDGGWAAARANFDWPFLPIVIAVLSRTTGLGLETVGFGLGALLMAGVCATLVQITRRQFPNAAWAACLVVLALPALNGYRDHIIREFGFWLFALAALLAALGWDERPRWSGAAWVHGLIGLACLFRVEAVVLYPALLAWQVFAARRGGFLRRVAMLCVPPGIVLLVGAGLAVGGGLDLHHRFQYYLTAANPALTMERFGAAADSMAAAVLNRYSADEAGTILFFGLLSILPVKFLEIAGVTLVPLAYALLGGGGRERLRAWQPLGWVFGAYVAVLLVFLMYQFFLTGRYVSFLNILAVPLASVGLAAMFARFPRWRWALILLGLVAALANVVSLGPKKTQYRDAGVWLSEHVRDPQQVFVEDGRIAYFAGWPLAVARHGLDRDGLAAAFSAGRYTMLALDVRRKDEAFAEWVASRKAREVARFTNRGGDSVVVLVRDECPPWRGGSGEPFECALQGLEHRPGSVAR